MIIGSRGFCRGLSRHAVSVCPTVCLSVTFVDCVKTNKHIFKIFSPSGSQAILVFPYQTAWQYSGGHPLTGASNARGVGRNRDRRDIAGYWSKKICLQNCVYWSATCGPLYCTDVKVGLLVREWNRNWKLQKCGFYGVCCVLQGLIKCQMKKDFKSSKSQYIKKSPETYCWQTNPICGTHHEKESVGSDRRQKN